MTSLCHSHHAEVRSNQRGIRPSDIELIIQYGTEVEAGVFFMSRQATERASRRKEQKSQVFDRITSKLVVVENDTVVTCYHPGQRKVKRVLRKGGITYD